MTKSNKKQQGKLAKVKKRQIITRKNCKIEENNKIINPPQKKCKSEKND